MKLIIQITQHFSFNVCNSLKYEKIEEKCIFFFFYAQFIQFNIYSIHLERYIKIWNLTDLTFVQKFYKIYHCVGQE